LSGRERTVTVFARYWLFQLPGTVVAAGVLFVLVRWELITTGVAGLLFGFWVLKDLLLFPVTRVGYERGGRPHGSDALLGSAGVVREEIAASGTGWVRVGPELWRARREGGGEALPVGAKVRVVGVDGLVLRVEPEQP
jgi:membrane protein implicated in regulation of membrane protease activity